MFDFDANKFLAAYHARSNEETRYYLKGVFIEPAAAGVNMVATDGHVLAAFNDCIGSATRTAIINVADVRKGTWRGVERVRWDGSSPSAELYVGFPDEDRRIVGHVAIEEIDGTFPEWRRVVPTANLTPGWPKKSFAFDVLKKVQSVISVFTRPNRVYLDPVRNGEDEHGPVIFPINSAEGYVLAMPARSDRSISDMPSLPDPAPETKKAA